MEAKNGLTRTISGEAKTYPVFSPLCPFDTYIEDI
jgi:hypothetical protein